VDADGRDGLERPGAGALVLRALKVPISGTELARRTYREVLADDCLGLAAQLAYYFFLALFPALLFLVAVVSFIPIAGLLDVITGNLARVAPSEVLSIIQDQILKIAHEKNGGLLTLGMLGTIWSTSSGLHAIIDTLNQAYDIQEARPWWKVKLIALGLTVTLALFMVIAFTLVLVGPTLAEKVAAWAHMGPAFAWTWKILQWPIVFLLVTLAVGLIYFFAPDAVQEWVWITPGAIFATTLWVAISLGFKFYVAHFTSYNATYGAIGGVIVLMLWFYLSALAVLIGAELNAEIEHASPSGKAPGEKVAGEKTAIGVVDPRPAPPAAPPAAARPRLSDWIVSGVVLGEVALVAYVKLRSRFHKIRS
jgi:membrane protein